jgi:hypothetical protein
VFNSELELLAAASPHENHPGKSTMQSPYDLHAAELPVTRRLDGLRLRSDESASGPTCRIVTLDEMQQSVVHLKLIADIDTSIGPGDNQE